MIAILGYLAALLTTFSFLPQAIYVLRTHDTKSLSLPMYIAFVLGVGLWLIYGLILEQLPIILANAVTFVFAAFILSYKIKELTRPEENEEMKK